MRVLQGSRTLEGDHGPFAVAIGIFDGVHRGHQELLRCAVELAERDDIESLAFTFHPHPAKVLAPAHAPALLEPLEARLERMNGLGVRAALVEAFDREFASQSPETFVETVLVRGLRAKHVVVGSDFHFGRNGSGDVAQLRDLGSRHGFEVHPIEPVTEAGGVISSTRIRALIEAGDMDGARLLMGHPYEVRGAVVRGEGRGRTIDVPTANVKPDNEQLPGNGVYAGYASGATQRLPAVTNIGVAPTFGDVGRRVEVHILDYAGGSLYGELLSVELLHKLRDEQKFDGIEALKAQIQRDILRARDLL